eukprot:g22181.t1
MRGFMKSWPSCDRSVKPSVRRDCPAGNSQLHFRDRLLLDSLPKSLAMTSLTALDISFAPLNGRVAISLAKALSESCLGLTSLSLAGCGLGSCGQADCVAVAGLLGAKEAAQVHMLMETMAISNLQLNKFHYTSLVKACQSSLHWPSALLFPPSDVDARAVDATWTSATLTATCAGGGPWSWVQALGLCEHVQQMPRSIRLVTNSQIPKLMGRLPQVVISKPPGWQVDYEEVAPPSDASSGRRLSELLRAVATPRRGAAPLPQNGFLHRLDVPSSGLILAARHVRAFYDLKMQLALGEIQRDYMVLGHGWIPSSRSVESAVHWLGRLSEKPSVVAYGKRARSRFGSAQAGFVGLQRADLSHNFFGAAGFLSAAVAVRKSRIRCLSFAQNGNSPSSGSEKVQLPMGRQYLHASDGENPLQLFLEGLLVNDSLQELDLSNCGVGFDTAWVLQEALWRHGKLHTLRLSENPLGEAGLRHVLRLITEMGETLQGFDLSGHREAAQRSAVKFRHAHPAGNYRLDLSLVADRAILRTLLRHADQRAETSSGGAPRRHINRTRIDPKSARPTERDPRGFWLVPCLGLCTVIYLPPLSLASHRRWKETMDEESRADDDAPAVHGSGRKSFQARRSRQWGSFMSFDSLSSVDLDAGLPNWA